MSQKKCKNVDLVSAFSNSVDLVWKENSWQVIPCKDLFQNEDLQEVYYLLPFLV